MDDGQYEALEKRPRRRRRRRRRPRGLLLLPHLITTANLAFGFFAIVQSFAGRHDLAALGIVLAALADAIDGRVARLAGASSRFGLEYDSIADTVSFGVAPAMLAFAAGNLQVLGKPGWVMAFTFTVCAALRLARFNVSPGRYKGRFEGMPSPAAALTIATTQWFVSFLREEGRVIFVMPEWLVALSVVGVGLLMVSPIPYRSGKELDLRHSFGTLVLVVIAILLVLVEHWVTLFAIVVAYMFSGPVELLWRRHTGQMLEELPAAPAHAFEPPPRG
ncbi:MAG: CDP-diacylglycerol--serine O-phosphatidyltransferase [Deltaproteobacteria bacterium]|nr:MAG: CDP-diacylglycerol--serine O-phosphatidyltransferase [Deltaproteobacteria bacterium]